MRWKWWVLPPVILLIGMFAAILAIPKARATLRLTPGLVRLSANSNVYVEPGGVAAARQIAASLPHVISRIEQAMGRPFKPGFRVVVCGSHESFARWIGHPADTPVMGIAFLKDVWISPRCLDAGGRDRHREAVGHELTHLHFSQHLFWYTRLRNIPIWFSEGLADWASGWEPERVSRITALNALRNGPRMIPETVGYVSLSKAAARSGVSWPMMHRQGELFIEYLVKRDAEAFQALLGDLLDGKPFGDAFRHRFKMDLPDAWTQFVDACRA